MIDVWQKIQRQTEEAMQRLEETLASLREELHERECQVAELHMTHQVRVALHVGRVSLCLF